MTPPSNKRYATGLHRLAILILSCSLLVASDAAAFKLRKNAGGVVLIWGKSMVNVDIDPSGIPDVPGVADAVRAGFSMWMSSGVPVRLEMRQSPKPLSSVTDGKNVVRWVTSDWPYAREVVAMTVATYSRGNGLVKETDMLFNAVDHQWTTTGATRRFDVQNVATHEAGHFFGLGHSDEVDATMFGNTPCGETDKRDLTRDDRLGIVALAEEIGRRIGPTDGPLNPLAQISADDLGGSALEGDTSQRVGCEVSGRPAAGGLAAPLLALIAVALLGRRRRSPLQAPVRARRRSARQRVLGSVMALLAAVVMTSSAEATTVKALSMDQLHARADVIARARVLRSHARVIGGYVFTEHDLLLSGCYKGACSARTKLLTPGGAVGDLVTHVGGSPAYSVGQELVVFGRKRAGTLRAVGLAQGVFLVKGKVVARDLRELQLMAVSRGGDGRASKPRLFAGKLQRFVLADLLAAIAVRTPGPAPVR